MWRRQWRASFVLHFHPLDILGVGDQTQQTRAGRFLLAVEWLITNSLDEFEHTNTMSTVPRSVVNTATGWKEAVCADIENRVTDQEGNSIMEASDGSGRHDFRRRGIRKKHTTKTKIMANRSHLLGHGRVRASFAITFRSRQTRSTITAPEQ